MPRALTWTAGADDRAGCVALLDALAQHGLNDEVAIGKTMVLYRSREVI